MIFSRISWTMTSTPFSFASTNGIMSSIAKTVKRKRERGSSVKRINKIITKVNKPRSSMNGTQNLVSIMSLNYKLILQCSNFQSYRPSGNWLKFWLAKPPCRPCNDHLDLQEIKWHCFYSRSMNHECVSRLLLKTISWNLISFNDLYSNLIFTQ